MLLLFGSFKAHAQATDGERLQRIEEMYVAFQGEFVGVPSLSAKILSVMPKEQRPILLDVRPDEERALSVIPGAITIEEFDRNPQKYRKKVLLAYCTIGYRSGLWARERRKSDWPVINLEGGILAWTHANGALEGPGGPTRQVHVYGAKWDLAHSDYVSSW
ncbi:MAG: rhodanese-like domain-containing protein [Proteobacteria bacterium]|nr:rhodanese-like domain-containing protein [Pseudomonadota bacterium]